MFVDRADAGARIAIELMARPELGLGPEPVVLALPRGGVPVAAPVARSLGVPLEVLLVRKLGHPRQPELGLGAIGEGGVRVLDHDLMDRTGVTEADLATVEARERVELERRAARYRPNPTGVSQRGRVTIVVDDGVATGGTVRVAADVARARGAGRLVLATPVASATTVAALLASGTFDAVATIEDLGRRGAIGAAYANFTQTTDAEVIEILDEFRAR